MDLSAVTDRLEAEGVKAFASAFDTLLDHLAEKAARFSAAPAGGTAARVWARDAALWKADAGSQAFIRGFLGWLDLPTSMAARLGEVRAFADEVRASGAEHVVVLGMGGSAWPQVRTARPAAPGWPRLHVLDSTDPGSVAACEAAAPPERTLYVVSSKSGTTVEPLRLMDYFLARCGGDARRFCAVTDPGSPFEASAREKGFRKVFTNPADVGGRFSALSLCGLVPAARAGWDVAALLARAAAMADATRSDSDENPGLSLGRTLAREAKADGQGSWPPPTSSRPWLEQLVAERARRQGASPSPAPRRRRRLRRRLRPGPTPARSRRRPGRPGRRPHDVASSSTPGGPRRQFFHGSSPPPSSGPAEMSLRPADVQAAKDMTKAATRLKSAGRLATTPPPGTTPERRLLGGLGCRTGAANNEEALARFLAAAAPGNYGALLAYVASDGRHADALAALRRALAETTGLSVQGGYGPRYLHSTGQLHKGGPNTGLFLVLAREGGADLEIPGAGLTFGQLCGAQALGDFRALDAAGRRAAYVVLKGDPGAALLRLAAAAAAASRAPARA